MITDHFNNYMLDALITEAGTVTVGLSTTKPAKISDTVGATNITEPATGTGYARVPLTASQWSAAANGLKATSSDIAFPAPTAAWGQVGWVVIWSGTRVVFTGELARLVNIVAGGDQLTIPAGTLSLSIAE